LVQFVDVNVTGIRKILKKHDKCMKTNTSGIFWKVKLGDFLKGKLGASRLAEPLLLQDDSLGALASILETGFAELHANDHQRTRTMPDVPAEIELPPQAEVHVTLDTTDLQPPSPQATTTSPLNDNYKSFGAHRSHGAHRAHLSSGNVSLGSLNHLFPAESSSQQSSPDMIILRIQAARQRLKTTNDFARILAAQLMVEGDETADEDDAERIEDEFNASLSSRSPISNLLNLLSTFFYITNYYIVAPTTASYALKLGGSPALASIIIGMTSVGALASTILYSWWTNHSYKSAIIFASTCSLIGNVLYALGLPYNSMTLVLVGRLFNGFGSARSINRRYIADTYSHQERTAASAVFVTAGSLGMAAGKTVLL
jgi:hypothetical protein